MTQEATIREASIGVVVPVYNERESLARLCDEILAVAAREGYELDVVLVDDGSTDGSWDEIASLAEQHAVVRGIRLRRNFGKAAALDAGFQSVAGAVVVTLDADLQDDPAEIPALVELIREGNDVVSGWKQHRQDPWHKVIPSRVFNMMVSRLTGVRLHDHNCGLKCYRREVLSEVHLYGELHRFGPVLAHAKGFRVTERPVAHRPRQHGQSKYGVGRFVKGLVDLLTVAFLTGFGQRPAHVLGALGLLSFAAGGLGLAYLAGYWVVAQAVPDLELLPLHRRPAVLYSLGALLLGGQLLSMGLLAEMIAAQQSQSTVVYSIAERTPARRARAGAGAP